MEIHAFFLIITVLTSQGNVWPMRFFGCKTKYILKTAILNEGTYGYIVKECFHLFSLTQD